MTEPRKVGFWIPVSAEIAQQASGFQQAIVDAIRSSQNMTPAQREEARRRGLERQEQLRRQVAHAHADYTAHLDGLLLAVADLHGPDVQPGWPVCQGCDIDGYEAEQPEWPCRTYRLVTGWEESA